MADETISDPEWSYVAGNESDYTQCLEVPGGWLYSRILVSFSGDTSAVSMCFVPWAPRKGQR